MEKQNIKYTADGKKVVVIGDLNQTEKIVQEIYVTEDGCEIPQGERFVVDSLLDVPAKSWEEKRLEELESTYKKESRSWNEKIYRLNQEKRIACGALSKRVKWLRSVAEEPQMKGLEHVLNTIADFMDGSEKWVLVDHFGKYLLENFNGDGVSQIMDRVENGEYNSMRLLSLFGKSDGSFEFKVNDYSDGSGCDRKVLFFKSREEALEYMQKKIDERAEYNSNDLENIETFSLRLDKEKYNRHQEEDIERSSRRIEELKASLEKEERRRDVLRGSLRK